MVAAEQVSRVATILLCLCPQLVSRGAMVGIAHRELLQYKTTRDTTEPHGILQDHMEAGNHRRILKDDDCMANCTVNLFAYSTVKCYSICIDFGDVPDKASDKQ
jgi:hypothetical protein